MEGLKHGNIDYGIVISHLLLQSVKTRVIKNNLNPVWNEKLMLSIPDNIPPLKVVSFLMEKQDYNSKPC